MADESRIDAIIDDEGRLFGLVNIIDALVILVVLAVFVAGVALVTGAGGGESTSRYATIDAGTQPPYIAGQITEGDTWQTGGNDLTITDVYKYPQPSEDGSGVHVLIRGSVNGTAILDENGQTEGISFGGDPLRYGRTLEIATDEYLVKGEVTDISAVDASLQTEQRSFVIQTTVDSATASSIQPGDQYVVGGEPIVTIESVNVYTTGNADSNRVVLGVSTVARSANETAYVGNTPLRTGLTIPIKTESFSLEGTVIRIGSLEEPGVPATRTITLNIQDVSPSTANALSAGMTAGTERGAEIEVVSVSDRPAEETVRSGAGYTVIEHPRNRDVTMTLDISVREQNDGSLRFRGEKLRIGQTLSLELEGVAVSGEVQQISG